MKFFVFASVLVSASAFATQYEATIGLLGEDSIKVRVSVGSIQSGKIESVRSRLRVDEVGTFHERKACVTEVQFEPIYLSVSLLDSTNKVLSQKTEISKGKVVETSAPQASCLDTLLRNQALPFLANDFITLPLFYRGSQVEVAISVPVRGTMKFDEKGRFEASMNPNSIKTLRFSVEGLTKDRHERVDGVRPLRDLSQPVDQRGHRVCDWHGDCEE